VQLIESRIKNLIASTDSVCVTVDLWSNRQMRSYLGVTGHLVDSNFNMISCLLTCSRFSGRHTASNIAANFEMVASKFDLTGKIDFIVSDNASNMVAAFDLPQFRDNVDTPMNSNDDLEDLDDVEPHYYDDIDSLNTLYEDLPNHERCFAHTLQLVIKRSLDSAESAIEPLKKVKKIVSFIRKSNVATDYLYDQPRAQAANETRWNSQLKSVRSVSNIDKMTLDSIPNMPVD
jgi:hypothetical protein